MDILVRRLRFQGKHGARASERREPRKFEVDLEVRANLERAAQTDQLADTIDYDWLCERIVEVGTGPPCYLLEALATRMVGIITEQYPHATVILELRKLNPPCVGKPAFTAVRLTQAPRMRRESNS